MTKHVVAPLALLAFVSAALGQERTSAKPDVSNQPPAELQRAGPGVGTAKRVTTETVKVKEVDLGKRVLVVQNAKGASQTIQVGPAVKRMDEVSPGDTINVRYEQNLVLEHRPEGSGATDRMTKTATAGPGTAPAAAQASLTRRDVKVTKVDEKSRNITLKGEDGKSFTVKAGPDIDLAKVKVGQTYYANYTEITAVSVQKAKPASAK